MKFRDVLKVRGKARLSGIDPGNTHGIKSKEAARARVERNLAKIDALQYLMYAENKHSLLIIFQAMDAGGKDGAIRVLTRGMNPQGCIVTSFKAPSKEEQEHDFLWRISQATPRLGDVGIFNRSQYEDVLIVRVHDLVPKSVWSARYEAINNFEAQLVQSGTEVIKFFLHISKEEQKRRFLERLTDPRKNWKFSPADLDERKHWSAYQHAFDDALTKCSTKVAPWYVIPSDKKWFRDLAVSEIVLATMQSWKMEYPKPSFDPKSIVVE